MTVAAAVPGGGGMGPGRWGVLIAGSLLLAGGVLVFRRHGGQ